LRNSSAETGICFRNYLLRAGLYRMLLYAILFVTGGAKSGKSRVYLFNR
jgi:hypothetical protein